MLRKPVSTMLILAAGLILAGCSGAETKRIAGEAVKGTLRSACGSADNCTQACEDVAQAPPGAKCAEKP